MGCEARKALAPHAGGHGLRRAAWRGEITPGEQRGTRASTELALGPAQCSCPRPVTGLPGTGHFQSNNNWENTQQVENWEVFGHHPPVLTQAMKLLSLCYFVEWKINPLQILVMCHISQPSARADLPAEDFTVPLGRRRE